MVALTLAEPEGYMRTFVDEGTPMRSLLLALRAHISASASSERLLPYVARLLEAFPPKASESPNPVPSPTLLSERELAVLQLIAEGRSVREIATSLVISAHTARTHQKNIYTKLDDHNRSRRLNMRTHYACSNAPRPTAADGDPTVPDHQQHDVACHPS
jgi:LuxR family maltose regulon positive regulatory protein